VVRIRLDLTLVFLGVLAAVVRKLVREQREPVVKDLLDQAAYLQTHILAAAAEAQAQPLVRRLAALLVMVEQVPHRLSQDLQ